MEDLGRAINTPLGAVDALPGLIAAGVAHKTSDGFVFASYAGYRAVAVLGRDYLIRAAGVRPDAEPQREASRVLESVSEDVDPDYYVDSEELEQLAGLECEVALLLEQDDY